MIPLSYASPPLTILVADDEPSIRLAVEAILRDDGHAVGVAGDGAEALRLFRTERWDLVLTDRAMPVMDGEALAGAIKKLSPRTPVIMVTGTPPRVATPAVDVIVTKPFTRRVLIEAISRALAASAHDGEPSEDYSAAA